MLNLQNLFKLVKFSKFGFILVYQRVGAVLDLMSCAWWDDHTRVWTIGLEKRVCWCHPSIDADVGARWDAMCPKVDPGVSWTKITLAACSGGFLTLRTKTWCHWSLWIQWLCVMHLFASLAYNALSSLLWWQSVWFSTPLWPMHLFRSVLW